MAHKLFLARVNNDYSPTIVSYSYLFWVKFLVSIELMNPDMYSPLRIGSHTCSSSPSVPPQHSWWPYLCNIHHPNSLHLIHFQEVFDFAQASYWRGEGSCLHTGHSSKYEEIIMECSKAPMKKEIYDFQVLVLAVMYVNCFIPLL